jgi:hypothetical protein
MLSNPPGCSTRSRRVFCLGISFLLFLLDAGLPAWSSDTSHYRVEVVVFESLAKGVLKSEFWPTDPGAPSLAGALELEDPGPFVMLDFRCQQQSEDCQRLGRSVAGPRTAKSHGFHLLPATEHRLGGVVKRLEASGRYRTLVHLAWQQPALTRKRALAVRIAGGWSRAAPLSSLHPSHSVFHHVVDGTFRLYRGRYLHALVDLVLYRSEPTVHPPQEQQLAFHGEQQPTPTPLPPTQFRLSEHRRMRSGELHYLDHPLFGLLVEVTPYRSFESSALTPADGDPDNNGGSSLSEEGANDPIEGDGD